MLCWPLQDGICDKRWLCDKPVRYVCICVHAGVPPHGGFEKEKWGGGQVMREDGLWLRCWVTCQASIALWFG
jgi:hypothetical protein